LLCTLMNERVMLTGGAGFIGSAVVDHLNELGCDVFVLDNLSFGKRELAAVPDSRFFEVDILDHRATADAVRAIAPAWAIHLAAVHFIPYCNAHPYESTNINLLGTTNVLDALRNVASVEKVFFASTAAVYADSPAPVAETSPAIPLDIYGLTKRIGERLVHEFHATTSVPCIIGRLFNAYGPRETNAHLIPEILRQVLEGKQTIELGNLFTRRDYIHTSDMARAISKLMACQIDGFDVFNIGSGKSFSAGEIIQFFERAINHPLIVDVAKDRLRKVDRTLLQADITKIHRATGWTPQVEIQQGITALVQEENVPHRVRAIG
jgi:UDP-glucose 4-epimerase